MKNSGKFFNFYSRSDPANLENCELHLRGKRGMTVQKNIPHRMGTNDINICLSDCVQNFIGLQNLEETCRKISFHVYNMRSKSGASIKMSLNYLDISEN